MNWEQKLYALKSLVFNASIEMRKPGDWYVSSPMEHADGESCLRSDYGDGATPEQAVEEHWKLYGNGEPFSYGEKWWLWNGFMWEQSLRPQNASRK